MVVHDAKPRFELHASAGIGAAEPVNGDFGLEPNLAGDDHTDPRYCQLCARDASYGPVLMGGRTYCSVECAQSVPGLYLG